MATPLRLTLRIENVPFLDTGGPLSIELEGRGCQAGRRPTMDWVLPDASRAVSSHHFDVAYRDGAYWLTDLSSNGTYLQGQRHRLQGPVPVSDGDRFLVGPYIIGAELRPGAEPPSLGPLAFSAPRAPVPDDVWDVAGVEAAWPPGDGAAVPAGAPTPNLAPDFAHVFHPATERGGPPVQPPSWAAPPGPVAPLPSTRAPNQPAGAPAGDARALLAAFCEGAGLDPAEHLGDDAEAAMRQAGRALKVASREIIRMLRDRAKVKESVAAGERTMLEPRENNPLKFAKDPSKAVEVLFFRPREGYLTGAEAVEAALDDLRRHQMAIFAAMQAALADLLDGLSPEEIEAAAGGGLFGGASKSRWDTFVKRWEDKAAQGENGMLDAFIRAFGKAYAEAASR